jgi:ribosomal protein S27AE
MKTSSLIIFLIGIILLISAFFIPFHNYLPAWIQNEGIYELEVGESKRVSMQFILGAQIDGTITITGGNDGVFFSIEDTQGNVLLSRKIVYNIENFEFIVPMTNGFSLVLENTPILGKTVYWISRIYLYNLAFIIIGVLLIVFGGIIMLRSRTIKAPKKVRIKKEKIPVNIVKKRCPRCGVLNEEKSILCRICNSSLLLSEKIVIKENDTS